MTNKILIAKITAAHGIQGDVKMVVFTNEAGEIYKYKCFDAEDKEMQIKIRNDTQNKKSKNGDFIITAKIAGIDNRDDAERLKNTEIFINRDDLEQLGDDEFYINDLVDLNVKFNDKIVGKVINVYDFGAGVMLEIEFEKENILLGYHKIETIPFKDEFFPHINAKEGFVDTLLPAMSEIKNT